ncbi:MAG: terminase, partial [Pseudomonadota bacterium]
QGRPHDLRVLDEAANFLESQVIFLGGWVRSEDPDQECQLLLVSNPPTGAEGQWLFDWFAAWLDPAHHNPAAPGELRWYARVNDEFVECETNQSFVLNGTTRIYEFNEDDYALEDIITPKSRTYIPARVTDNPYYVKSGYIATLQALHEPLRSQMLKGDFAAGRVDDAWQVIPTGWVKAAQERWKVTPKPKVPMYCIGVDPSRGGRD